MKQKLSYILMMLPSIAYAAQDYSTTVIHATLLACMTTIVIMLIYVIFRKVKNPVHNKIKILSVKAVGYKEKIALISVDNKSILVGITPQNINTLCLVETDASILSPEEDSFSDRLRQSLFEEA